MNWPPEEVVAMSVKGFDEVLELRTRDGKGSGLGNTEGYHLGEHFVEFTEMAELGNGGVREVISIKLSRAACMAIAMNTDQKKEMVKVAQKHFSATIDWICKAG